MAPSRKSFFVFACELVLGRVRLSLCGKAMLGKCLKNFDFRANSLSGSRDFYSCETLSVAADQDICSPYWER